MRDVNILMNYTYALKVYTVIIGTLHTFCLCNGLDNQGIVV